MSTTASPNQRPGRIKLVLRFALPFLVAIVFFWWWLPSQPRLSIRADNGRLRVLGLSPDGTVLAVLKEDPPPSPAPGSRQSGDFAEKLAAGIRRANRFSGEVQFWEISSGRLRATLAEPLRGAPHALFSPDGKLFATDSFREKCYVHLWDTSTGQAYGRLDVLDLIENPMAVPWPRVFAFSPDGQTIAYALPTVTSWSHSDGASLWDVAARRDRARLPDADWPFAFSPDGTLLASAAHRRKPTGEAARYVGRKLLSTAACLTHPSPLPGSLLLFVDPDLDCRAIQDYVFEYRRDIVLWDVATGREHQRFANPVAAANQGSAPDVLALAFSSNGRKIAALLNHPLSGWMPPEVAVWDTAIQKPEVHAKLPTLRDRGVNDCRVRCLAPDRHLLIDLHSPLFGSAHVLCDATAEPARLTDLVFDESVCNSAGTRLAQSNTSELKGLGRALPALRPAQEERPPPPPAVRLLDVTTLQAQELCRPGWRGSLKPLSFSPDGKMLAVQYIYDWPFLPEAAQPLIAWLLGREGVVRLYEVSTGTLLGTAEGGAAWFTPDGRTLITSGVEGIRVFDLPLAFPASAILIRSLVASAGFILLGWTWRLWRVHRKARFKGHT
jgi:WD40 repeat protein